MSQNLIKFIRKLILIETNALSLAQKDILYNKINEIGQDFHFMKFNIISTGELSFPIQTTEKKVEQEEAVENIKKVSFVHQHCLMVGAYFLKHCKVTSRLDDAKKTTINKLLNKPGQMDIELDLNDLIKKDHSTTISYAKTPDCYKVEEYENIEEHFARYTALYKRHLDQEIQADSLFKAYRAVLDLQQFKEKKNSLVFWKDYIRQLFDQLPLADQNKLWTTLNDMLNYSCRPILLS